jgi:hypothetical protein
MATEDLQKTLLNLGQQFLQTEKGKALIAKAEGIKDKVDDFKLNKELLEKYKPVILTFTTKGRLFDAQKGEPIPFAKVEPQLLLYPMKLERYKKKIKVPLENPTIFKKNEKIEIDAVRYVFDKNAPKKEIRTDLEGRFELRFGVPALPNLNNRILVKPILLYDAEGYLPDTQTLITGGNEVLQTLPIKNLINLNEASKQASQAIKEGVEFAAVKAAQFALDSAELAINVIQAQVMKMATVCQTKLFPLAVSLMIVFGIAKREQAKQKMEKCPNNALLKATIKKRNSIVRQINQIWGVIAANTALAGIILYLSIQFKIGKIQIGSIPLPLGSPLGTGVPYNIVSKLQGVEDLFKSFENFTKELRTALLISLVFLIISLIIILKYLKTIDLLIEKCSDGNIPMDDINAELLALAEAAKEDGNEEIQLVNGFSLSVDPVISEQQSNENGDLYRRKAVARNASGIIILEGEPSFSAEDQILLDELAFYIKQNNLKAY